MINPSEISEVLKQQLDNVNSKVSFEETGTVLEVGDGVAHVYGLDNVRANELVEFENGVTGVALNLEESNVGVILFDNVDTITEGMSVKCTGEIASIPVGEGLFGRVINILGEPIDGNPTLLYDFLNEEQNVTYRYLTVLYESDDGFWMVQFASQKDNFDAYEPSFIEAARSVSFSA